VEHGAAKIVVNPLKVPIDRKVESHITTDLETMKAMSGEFKFDSSGERAYEDWYRREREMYGTPEHPMHGYIDGYVSRRPTLAIKLGMIMSAIRGNEYRITEEDFSRGIGLMERVEPTMPEIMKGMATTKYFAETNMLMDRLRVEKKMSRERILQVFQAHIDLYKFNNIRDTLVAAGMVSNHDDPKTKGVVLTALEV
jgi:hypothetical protein